MLLPIFGFVLLDGIFLYAVLSVAFLGVIFCLQHDKPAWCTVDIVLVLLGLQFFTTINPLQYVLQNPIDTIMLIFGYLVIGTIWIVVKWHWHINIVQNKFDAIKNDKMQIFINDYGVNVPRQGGYRGYNSKFFTQDNVITDEGKKSFLASCTYDIGERCLPMKVNHYKSKLYMWWICWPASLIVTLLSDFFETAWTWVINRLHSHLQRASDASIKIP